MEENQMLIDTEGATPIVEATDTEESAIAQETVETPVETEETETGEGATPPVDEGAGAAQEAESTTGEQNVPVFISVPHKHEVREMSAEEAVPYIQMGLKMEEIKPEIEMLRTISAANGQTLSETVRGLFGAFERSHRNEILQRVGGNEEAADALMEKKRQEWNVASQTARETEKQAEQDSRKALENRLAAEYGEIVRDFPEYDQFSKIPREVTQDAIKNGRSLYDSLLRYRHKESRRVSANEQSQMRAAAASAGSQASTAQDRAEDPVTAALMSGLHRALH